MFYDTTILANADLTTADGKEYFYVNVRDFYSRIPPHYWAAIDDRPIVWLYDTAWVSAFDQSSLDYLSDRFAQDFGGLRLFVVRESQWQTSKGVDPPEPVTSQGLYAWGAAVAGYNPAPELTDRPGRARASRTRNTAPAAPTTTASTSTARAGRATSAICSRQSPARARCSRSRRGTSSARARDIAETVETGRQYIDLTRTYADRFKQG